MTATTHPDDEDLSALVDGESDPDVAGHVEGCQQCAARVDTLRRVAAAVGRAPAPASAAGREAALAAALAEAGQQPDAPVVEIHDYARRRRTPRPFPGWLAAAAVVLALVIAVPLLVRNTSGSQRSAKSTALTPARSPSEPADSRATAGATAGNAASAPSASAPVPGTLAISGPVAGGDIGDQSDPRHMAILAAIDFELRRPLGAPAAGAPTSNGVAPAGA